ncbi:lipopolysaccharide heptosyltransferase II [Mariprofundus sp. NF]|uniref:lipopolysaccharide heptosyltransferase II n=1 Tax=Mariprofundus sp. NF TaxID=2608716 RepID=UPI0015A08A2E|nr:lipopolysaccharide heptosyltransferase II [Mariprofundus sp. NF]NWF39420.1 lipopolysaccharide heptosyltransferase II [Mariprofundus sp. NF]
MSNRHHLLLMPPNWIGDVIMAQPAMVAISSHYRQQFENYRISVCGRGWLKDLLPYLNIEGAEFSDTIMAADTAYLFPNSFRSAWNCKKAGVKNIIGYRGQWRSLLLSQAISPRIDTRSEHHRGFHMDLARQTGITTGDDAVELIVPSGDKQRGREMMQNHGLDADRTICIAPGAQFGTAKCYPAEGFAAVVKTLAEQGWQPMILGMPEDHAVAEKILENIDTPFWNATGATTLSQALQLIAASQLMLCNDSGLMHVAAGIGIPTVTPFGATDPARTSPCGPKLSILYQPADCSPCLQRECTVKGHPCMANITPEMLTKSCLAMLAG